MSLALFEDGIIQRNQTCNWDGRNLYQKNASFPVFLLLPKEYSGSDPHLLL